MLGEVLIQTEDGFTADSLALLNNILVCGQSRKEGNIWDGRLTLYSLESGAQIEKLTPSGIAAVETSVPSNRIICGQDDGKLSIFSDCLEEIHSTPTHDDIITSISVNPFNDNDIISVSWDGQICFSDAHAMKVMLISGHSGIINDVAHNLKQVGVFSTVGQDCFLRLWDSRCLHQGCTGLLPLCQIGAVCSWSLQSEYQLLCGMEDGGIQSIDTRNLRILSSKIDHNDRITSLTSLNGAISASAAASNIILSSSVDKSICAQNFDLSGINYNRVSSLNGSYPLDIIWMGDASKFAVSCSDRCVRLMDSSLILPS